MELSPRLYDWFVRPKWFSDIWINDLVVSGFDFQNKMVLDFGCGIGSSSSMFSPEYYLGVDCDPKRIYYARRKTPNYRFEVANGSDLPLPQSSIDFILIIAVLHHIPREELPGYLDEFHRILRPQGTLIVYEPYFSDGFHLSNYFMKLFDRGAHIQRADEYLKLFIGNHYGVKVHGRYRQLCLYNKLFFSATLVK